MAVTQLVFCDLSTPKAAVPASRAAKAAGGNLDSPELHALEAAIGQDTAEEPAFTIYDDIREKLVARGIPREQIAFIHEANTEARKKELFAKVRAGQVRVLMGSTFKMGAGMNVQDRLVALHDLDCPWRPGDLEQRSGRIIRQGKPFPQEEELRVKSARLAELNAELNIDERTPMEQLADDAAISAKAERPSVLARLKNTPTRQTQDTPEKQREQESR